MRKYRYVSSVEDLKEDDYDLLKEYANRLTHIMTEVNDSSMVFEDGTKGPFGQFKSFYNLDNFYYLIHESASCCPNSNTVLFEKTILNESTLNSTTAIRCTVTEDEENYKFTDNVNKHSIVIDKTTIDEFIKKIKN